MPDQTLGETPSPGSPEHRPDDSPAPRRRWPVVVATGTALALLAGGLSVVVLADQNRAQQPDSALQQAQTEVRGLRERLRSSGAGAEELDRAQAQVLALGDGVEDLPEEEPGGTSPTSGAESGNRPSPEELSASASRRLLELAGESEDLGDRRAMLSVSAALAAEGTVPGGDASLRGTAPRCASAPEENGQAASAAPEGAVEDTSGQQALAVYGALDRAAFAYRSLAARSRVDKHPEKVRKSVATALPALEQAPEDQEARQCRDRAARALYTMPGTWRDDPAAAVRAVEQDVQESALDLAGSTEDAAVREWAVARLVDSVQRAAPFVEEPPALPGTREVEPGAEEVRTG